MLFCFFASLPRLRFGDLQLRETFYIFITLRFTEKALRYTEVYTLRGFAAPSPFGEGWDEVLLSVKNQSINFINQKFSCLCGLLKASPLGRLEGLEAREPNFANL